MTQATTTRATSPAATTAGPSTPTRKKRTRPTFSIVPYAFIGAAVLYLLFFTAYPLIQGMWLSFTDTKLLNPTGGQFTGLENYQTLVENGSFVKSVITTLVYTVFTVIGCVLLGTISAIVINRYIPGRSIVRSILVMPWAVPTVALALVFRWIYNDTNGVANDMTRALGIGEVGWLTDTQYGMAAVVIATVWKLSPFVMLVVLAAMQSVPDELYEAARVDGSGPLTTFRSIVMPFLMPTIRVVTLLMTIWSFRRFEIIWLLTGGGPVDATTTIVISVYREAFSNNALGLAAAAGVLGLLLSLVVTVIYFFVERRAAQKEGV